MIMRQKAILQIAYVALMSMNPNIDILEKDGLTSLFVTLLSHINSVT